MGLSQLKHERAVRVAEAVGTLLQQIDVPTLHEIVWRGEEEFIKIARANWTGHGFRRSDFQDAFQMLRGRASKMALPQSVRLH